MTGSPYRLKADPYSSHSVILRFLPDGAGKRLLDVGAAEGYLAELLGRRGFEVTCLERDPGLAAVAAEKCRRVVTADLERELPLLDGPFDVIVYGDVLEHLSDPARVLSSLNQSLKEDGIVIVSVPNVAHLWVRLQLLLGRFDYADRGILDRTHLRFFTRRSFLRFLGDSKLKVIEMIPTPVPLPLLVPERLHGRWLSALHALNALTARCWQGLFAYQFVAVARREQTR
ncbi:MAG: class I SAM-dependent methyltransferase [Candidatus Rokubacteria bacterium]|nr:class I SAM-dependent methyltransferase [Candidatus Rokubacteria bacterium]